MRIKTPNLNVFQGRMENSFYVGLFSLAIAPLAIGQVVTTSGTWYLTDGGTDNAISATTADLDTIAISGPTSTNDYGAVTALSSTVSLTNVGDFIQFSGDFSGDIGNNVNEAIRIGFYNSNGNSVSSNFSAASDNWIGFFAGSGNRSTTGATSNNFVQPLNTDKVLDMGDSSPNNDIGGTVNDISTGARTITFRIEKTSATDLSLRLISGNVDHTDTFAIASAPTTTFDFLAVSFKLTSGSSAEFDNIQLSTVPEPSTFAILAGFAALGLVICRRRMR